MTPLLASGVRTDRSFERLYRRHVADVYHYALAVLRNPADAEDVTQTTFLNAYRAYERGERPHAPHNWLIAIAHNVCRQRFRQTARRPQEVEFDADVADVVPDDDTPTAEDIRKALGHLAFNQRAALVMRELEGRSYSEIGEILGLSVSAVETLIFRARRALREQLEGSLTCREAEVAISRQADGLLSRAERGPLRAHLRECGECATFARSQRAQRAAFKALAAVPIPSSLASFFGGGTAATVGAGVLTKAATVVAASLVAGGVGYEAVKRVPADGLPSPLSAAARPGGATKAAAVEEPLAAVESAVAAVGAAPATSRLAAATRPAPRGGASKNTRATAEPRGKGGANGADGKRGKTRNEHASEQRGKSGSAKASSRGKRGKASVSGGRGRAAGPAARSRGRGRPSSAPQRPARPAPPPAPVRSNRVPPRSAVHVPRRPKAKPAKSVRSKAQAVVPTPPPVVPVDPPTVPKLPKK